MRVTICQWDSRPEVLSEQLQALAHHCTLAGSELVLLPEMPFDSWLVASDNADPDRWELSAKRHLEWVGKLTELKDAMVVATRPAVDDGDKRYNRAFYWTAAGGLVDVRDKVHLPDEDGYWEARWYQPGSGELTAIKTDACRIGVLVCSELWFLEHARQYGQDQAHLLCIPRATPALGTEVWIAAGRTAAVVSGTYCLSSNQYRPEGAVSDVDMGMGGTGWVIDPEGTLLAITTPSTPYVTIDIDLEYAKASKQTYPRYLT